MSAFLPTEMAEVTKKITQEVPSFTMKFDSDGNFDSNFEKKQLSPLSNDIPKFKDLGNQNEQKTEKTETKAENILDNERNKTSESGAENIADASNAESEGVRRIPKENGGWTGEPGNSEWIPDKDYVPKVYNPDEKTWGDILEKHDIDGISFKDGEPDFSDVAESTVEIDDFSDSRTSNFAQADEKLADQWNKEGKDGRNDWNSDDVADYREENNLTWHERSDMKTMDLVPSEVHNNVPHSGGISEIKKQEN